MTFPVVQSRGTGTSGTSDTTSHSITLPSGVSTNDCLVVIFSVDGNPTCTPDSGSVGRGWQKYGYDSNGSSVTGAIFVKQKADGNDALTVNTSASEQSTHVSLRISGGMVHRYDAANGSSTNSNPPSVSTFHGTDDVLWIVTRSGDSTTQASAAPSNFSNLTTSTAGGASGASTATAERSVNSSSQDPGGFTSGNEQWVSWTIAVVTPHAKAEATSDTFGTEDTGKWSGWGTPPGGGDVRVSGGRVEIDINLDYDSVLERTGIDDLTGSYMFVEVVDVPDASGSEWLWFELTRDDASVFIAIGGGNLNAMYRLDTTETTVAQITYNSTSHRWLRMRESAGVVYYDYSADGLSWTQWTSVTWPGDLPVIGLIDLGGGYWDDIPDGPFIFDNYNIAPTLPARFFLAY